MTANTPPLDNQAKKTKYIEDHLFNELRWMLGAATEWSIQEQLALGIAGYDVHVYAMDSAFLHARTLFEFFLNKTGKNYYGCDQFLNIKLESVNYTNDWRGPLHSYLMHAQDRSSPRQLKSLSGEMKDLNKMPVDFAHEILRLWKEFEEGLGKSGNAEDQQLQKLARGKRKEAIDGALCVVNSTITQHHANCKGQTLKPAFVFHK
jgi:hypothetical protein